MTNFNNIHSFEKACAEHLGLDCIHNHNAINSYKNNITGYTRVIPLVLKITDIQKLQAIVLIARQYKVPLYPISQGKNWGLGSKLPTKDNSVVIDLSDMNKIREINEDLGYAVIEAGVTQKQLSDELLKQNSSFFLDVTGSGQETSIIGNSLERGVAYNTLRAEVISSMEIVLGNGNILKTGFSHFENSNLSGACKYGVGPSLDGIFFQSNFGIVVSATIKLVKKPVSQTSFNISISEEENVPPFMENLRNLMNKQVLSCITHVFNRERFYPGMAPIILLEAQKRGLNWSKQDVELFLKKELPGSWWAIGQISGTKGFVKEAKSIVKKELSKYGSVLFTSEPQLKFAKKMVHFLGLKNKQIILNATEPLRGLSKGIPTNATLYSIIWPLSSELTKWNPLEPDKNPAGFIYSVPVIPLTENCSRKILKLISSISQEFHSAAAVSLNTASTQFAEVVVSLDFPLENPEKVMRAHQCIDKMNQVFMEQGFTPYRLDIQNISKVLNSKDIFWKTVQNLKQVLDPDEIISPGRYNLI